ncbi:MAG TPA: AbiV family abortive infection protein [Opitutaceae bacterium]|nr:AbiV family abortive infection protein [Opitutaceae bacterium]
MASQKLQQYKGLLSPVEVTQGIKCAQTNAKRLIEDAELLLGHERYASALALATLAIEEAGKVPILRSLALARSDEEAKADWKEYRSHTSKNRLWPVLEYALKGARRLDDFAALVATDADHPLILDQLKQLSFYTDCLGKKHWSVPNSVIDKNLAALIVRTAKILSADSEISQREIELWIQHVGPVWKQNKEVMEKALVDWYTALQAENLKPAGENAMREFIVGGLNQTSH